MLADPALVETLRSALADRQDVKLALLFGSRERGRFRPDSDVDVAYLGKDVDPLELASHLSRAVRHEVQTVGIAEASYPAALRNIVAHGYSNVEPALIHAAAMNGPADLERFGAEVSAGQARTRNPSFP